MGNATAGRRNSILSKESSVQGETSRQNTLVEDGPPLERPDPLTDQQRSDLARTWKVIQHDIEKVGVITFISLFETHPDVQQVFMPFNGIELEELKHSKQLRGHALSMDNSKLIDMHRRFDEGFKEVMCFIEKAIARLNEPEKLEQLTHDLGKKHHHYKAKAKYVDLVGPQFFKAIKPSLGDEWTDEVAGAWTLLFAHVGFIMKSAMTEAAEEESRGRQ